MGIGVGISVGIGVGDGVGVGTGIGVGIGVGDGARVAVITGVSVGIDVGGMAAIVAAIRASTVASILGGSVDVAVGTASATAVSTTLPTSGVGPSPAEEHPTSATSTAITAAPKNLIPPPYPHPRHPSTFSLIPLISVTYGDDITPTPLSCRTPARSEMRLRRGSGDGAVGSPRRVTSTP